MVEFGLIVFLKERKAAHVRHFLSEFAQCPRDLTAGMSMGAVMTQRPQAAADTLPAQRWCCLLSSRLSFGSDTPVLIGSPHLRVAASPPQNAPHPCPSSLWKLNLLLVMLSG